MIWRVFGWWTVTYLVLGTIVVALVGTNPGLGPQTRVDWSYLTTPTAAALWIHTSLSAFPAFVVAAVPGPFGFFRRAQAQGGRLLMLTYSLLTLTIAAVAIASVVYLVEVGPVQMSATSGIRFTVGDVIGTVIFCVIIAFPAVAALFGLRRPKAKVPGGMPKAWGGHVV